MLQVKLIYDAENENCSGSNHPALSAYACERARDIWRWKQSSANLSRAVFPCFARKYREIFWNPGHEMRRASPLGWEFKDLPVNSLSSRTGKFIGETANESRSSRDLGNSEPYPSSLAQNSVIHPPHAHTTSRHGRSARILLWHFGNHRFRCHQEASDRTRIL